MTQKVEPCLHRPNAWMSLAVIVAFGLGVPTAARAQERLCDNSFEDCRTPIINMIRAENVGLDVSFWVMTDTRYSTEIISRWQAGVPVRILLDLRSDQNYPAGATVRQSFINAGIPIRHKTTTGINHWKMILYAGQNKMHFSAANFASGSYSPTIPYTRYVDEAIYFTEDPDVVHTFMTKYDDLWTNTTHYQNLANINGPLLRNYPTYAMDPELNFPPDQDYQDRLVSRMRLETQQIDVVMFRITSAKVPDEMIRRRQAGVPVRLITDQDQYRNTTYFWHSYNVDRMYMAEIPIKWKRDDSTIEEDMHQKSVVLAGTGMTIFGSSNWTSSSSDTQREHNYFTVKPWIKTWFAEQFNRKWNNVQADGVTPVSPAMFLDFVPGWPETPVNVSPANAALGVASSVPLRWEGGWWAHKYDIYFGTTNPPPLIAEDYMPGSATAGVSSNKESFNPCSPPAPFVSVCPGGLAPGVTYYWKVRGKTMVGNTRAITGPTWSFTTGGGAPPPPAPTNLQVTGTTPTSVSLAWTDVAGEEGYKVERKLASASTWTEIATTPANTASYSNSGLTANTTYNYRVRAYTSGGHSAYSNTVTVTTPASSPETGRILADTYVRGGQYASTNYGTATELITKFNADSQYNRQSYLKLDISEVQPNSTVRLRLFGHLSDTRAASVQTGIYPLSSSSWSETAVAWNTGLTTGALWTTLTVSGTTAQWYEIDITGPVQAQRAAGQTVVAIALKCTVDTLPFITFGSRESGNKPQLVITP
jgi:phosphatidylserine/phosphatidylglycerophosphate/cardiolipin synthase-like enzyme